LPVSEYLKEIGYNVNIFLDSTDAYEFIRRNKDQCDLLITDLTMPNMTGDKLAEEIFYNIKKIPIILCSGYNENIDEKSMEKAGITLFLQKPFKISELSVEIRKILNSFYNRG
jgi:CheY-like chemotaxis protein